MTGEDSDSFLVDIHPVLEPELSEAVVRATAASGEARIQQLEASIANREAAELLARSGLPVRDIGRLLGISHQRVQQLLADQTKSDVLRDRLRREMARVDDPRTQAFEVKRRESATA
jgi:DNA-binding CsgD family transcriptional regulator